MPRLLAGAAKRCTLPTVPVAVADDPTIAKRADGDLRDLGPSPVHPPAMARAAIDEVMEKKAVVPAATKKRDDVLADLAVRINDKHDLALQSVEAFRAAVFSAGEMLLEAKAMLGHGKWEDWLRANVKIKPRMAQNYMQLARHRPEIESKTQSNALLTITDMLGSLRPQAPALPPREVMEGLRPKAAATTIERAGLVEVQSQPPVVVSLRPPVPAEHPEIIKAIAAADATIAAIEEVKAQAPVKFGPLTLEQWHALQATMRSLNLPEPLELFMKLMAYHRVGETAE
jgi:hypothetical protein